jgi:thiamine transporter ThiT
MKTSTRIFLAAIVVWIAFIVGGQKADLFSLYSDDMQELVIGGVVLCILLKFILGALVDKKSDSKSE